MRFCLKRAYSIPISDKRQEPRGGNKFVERLLKGDLYRLSVGSCVERFRRFDVDMFQPRTSRPKRLTSRGPDDSC